MKFSVIQGSILNAQTTCIVNPANPQLLHGGGLSGIIHEAAGEELFKWLRNWKIKNDVPLLGYGKSLLSPSFDLKQYRGIIHTIGAVYKDGKSNEATVLSMAYRTALDIAEQEQYESIAFPNISTGIYGYPKIAAAKIAIRVITEFEYQSLKEIIFYCYEEDNYRIYSEILETAEL